MKPITVGKHADLSAELEDKLAEPNVELCRCWIMQLAGSGGTST